MILTCPQCETRYQTDAARFWPEGRTVRCAKCGNVWHQASPAPPEEAAPPAFVPVEEREAAPRNEPPQHHAYAPSAVSNAYVPAGEAVAAPARGDRVSAAAGWVGMVALILLIGWSAMHFRQEIAVLWPKSASLYAALGEPVNTRGLEIRNLRYHNESDDGQSVLAVSGRLANITARELSVPPIRVTLTDDDKRVLYDWSFSANVAMLKPGQAVNFVTRLSGLPNGARHMQVQFADNKE
jgi:predicted Zn finger-like uncharacterized protein